MENIKTIPMSTEEIQELFINPGSHYQVDLRNSKLKGEAFVTYIANMQINCSLVHDKKLSQADKFEVMDHFLSFRQTVKCDTLLTALSQMLLYIKGGVIAEDLVDSFFDAQEIDRYFETRKDVIERAIKFIESAVVFVPAFHQVYRHTIFKDTIEMGKIEVIEDPDYIGVNVLGLITLPGFVDCMVALPLISDKSYYFKEQVENFVYDRKNTFTLFMEFKESSFLMAFYHMALSMEEETIEAIEECFPGSMEGVKPLTSEQISIIYDSSL